MKRRKARRIRGEIRLPLLAKGKLEALGSVPIMAAVGYNGMGKSLLAVAIAMAHLDSGRPVLSTARLLDWRNPRPCSDAFCKSDDHGSPGHMAAHPLWIPHTDFRDLFSFTDGHVLWDEVTGVADAREHQSMPVQVSNFLPQLRRRQVTFCWTTIDWSFADVRLRRLTWASAWAVGMAATSAPGEIWPRNRLFYYRSYDAKNLPDDFQPKTRKEDIRAMHRCWLWGPRSDVFRAYDSGAAVSMLGAANEAGMCLNCGGKRRPAPCACGKPTSRRPVAGAGSERAFASAALDALEETSNPTINVLPALPS